MRILGICNNEDIIQCISDTLFNKQVIKEFHLSEDNCNLDTTFLYYADSYSILEYINKNYSSKQDFIKDINNHRDINGVPLSIIYESFRVIATDEELKLIYNNQPELYYPESTIMVVSDGKEDYPGEDIICDI